MIWIERGRHRHAHHHAHHHQSYHHVDKQLYRRALPITMDLAFMEKLGRARDAKRFVKLIRGANKDQMRTLVDTTVKIMRKEVPVAARLRNRIIKNRRLLRHVANPGYSMSRKRKYLVQKGGMMGLARIFTGLAKLAPRLLKTASMPALRAGMPSIARSAPLMRSASMPNLSRVAQAPSHAIRAPMAQSTPARLPRSASFHSVRSHPSTESSIYHSAPKLSTRSGSYNIDDWQTGFTNVGRGGVPGSGGSLQPPVLSRAVSGESIPSFSTAGTFNRGFRTAPLASAESSLSTSYGGSQPSMRMPSETSGGVLSRWPSGETGNWSYVPQYRGGLRSAPSSGPTSSYRGSERYLSELGRFPPDSIRSAPPILDRASLSASEMSHRWPGGIRNQRVGLPRTGMGGGSQPSFHPSTMSQSNVSSFRSGSGTGPEYYSRAKSDVASFRPPTTSSGDMGWRPSILRRKDSWSDLRRRFGNLVNDDVGSYRSSTTSSGDLARLPSTPRGLDLGWENVNAVSIPTTPGSSASSGLLPIYRMSSSAGNFR